MLTSVALGKNLKYGDRMYVAESGSFVVGWGTLTLINAGLAQAKGRSGLNWWLLSILLGPIATFFLVVMAPLRDA